MIGNALAERLQALRSSLTHSSQVFLGRPGPFLPGIGMVLTLFISLEERMTWPNHHSRRSRMTTASSHRSSFLCSSSMEGSSANLTPHIQRIMAQSLRHSRWSAAEGLGQVSVACNLELRTLEEKRLPLSLRGKSRAVNRGRCSRNFAQADRGLR